jgi:hypothetical protein
VGLIAKRFTAFPDEQMNDAGQHNAELMGVQIAHPTQHGDSIS